ncbi:hypothetical protein GETHLI_23440 [Geothrix limicola]|uniref:Uncharacterized protein n=1 Tax=Geothrix limicola TaxID=2927978 RepID=A0ABQ5QGQ5_9BACT|nr:hypothetical protein [Geothrix limicola]GLH73842.1 hypothetical protein GETHLI_23440 [Geothrix limicola]
MAAHTFRHPDLDHSELLNWALALVGALVAWWLWPTAFLAH